MKPLPSHAQRLVYTLLNLMFTHYQRETLEALLGLFLQANGRPLPALCRVKSASALSRFLNRYGWPVRALIRTVRRAVLEQAMAPRGAGRRPCVTVVVDLSCLEKTGKFTGLDHLIHILNGKRGLHVVVLYLVIGAWRVPWGVRVWRGKEETPPAALALKLLRTLPLSLRSYARVRVLADAAFGTIEFLEGVRALGFQAVIGMRCDRCLEGGGQVRDLRVRGEQVRLTGLSFPVWVSWVWLEREGRREQRFVVSTCALSGRHIARWGKRRWQIEGFFKTAKHRFGLDRFGQGTRQGVYRWIVLSFLAFLLAHWAHLATAPSTLPDWGVAARTALEGLLAGVVLLDLLLHIKRLQPLARSHGLNIRVTRCKI